MKKKIIAIVSLLALVASIGSFSLFKKDTKTSKPSNSTNSANTKQIDFKFKSAFADIDSDMVIESKDAEDDDKKFDYIFITFTNPIVDTKKDDSSNPFNIKNYTLDKNPLPKDTSIALGDANQIIIKLPDGYLKGTNAPHSLTASKDLKDKNGQSIQGPLDFKLPYSIPSSNTSDKKSDNNSTKSDTANTNNSQKSDSKTNSAKTTNDSDKKNVSDAAMPKYTVKIINSIPQTTVVAVTLDSPNPENYKVSVGGAALELKKNSKGEMVFVSAIEKEYGFDEVNKLIKIEKVK